MSSFEDFNKSVQVNAFNTAQRLQIEKATGKYIHALDTAVDQYANLNLARDRAAYYKWKILESLDKYLIEFEANVIRKGGKVIWAVDAEAALSELGTIIKKNQIERIVKAKTNIGEEIGLSAFFKEKQLDIVEGGIGEYIASRAGEGPYHMVNPVLQKTAAEISHLLNDSIGVSIEASPEEITRDIRNELREKFVQAEMAITGANFLISENGMVVLTENEGNIRMAVSFAKTHVVLAGIDKIIPTMNDLDIYFPLLATYSTGQTLATYNTIVGPRQPGETDGPTEFIVVLIDNGRSNLLAQPDQRQSLSCIMCGACSNVCPVYHTLGGHDFKNGPIGAVTKPHMHGMDEFKHLSYASPLCGKCTDICPVKIDLHNHLLRNRRDSVHQGFVKSADKLIWFSWKKMMLSRKHMNRGSSVKNFMLKSFFKTAWGEGREFPKVADKSFNQMWRERTGQ